MVPAGPPISNSSNPLTKLLETVPSAIYIISITITFLFHHRYLDVTQLFQLSGMTQVFVHLFTSFNLHFVVRLKNRMHQMTKSFLLINTRCGLQARIECSICISTSIIIIITHLRVVHISVSRWYLTGV